MEETPILKYGIKWSINIRNFVVRRVTKSKLKILLERKLAYLVHQVKVFFFFPFPFFCLQEFNSCPIYLFFFNKNKIYKMCEVLLQNIFINLMLLWVEGIVNYFARHL